MKQIGITVYTTPEKVGDPQLQYQVFDGNTTVDSGEISQSRVFNLPDNQALQIRNTVRKTPK